MIRARFLFSGLLTFLALSTRLSALDIGVATTSAIKIDAVKRAFEKTFPQAEIRIHAFKAASGVADQPVTWIYGVQGGENRLARAKSMAEASGSQLQMDYWIAMENYIAASHRPGFWLDRAAVVVEHSASRTHSVTFSNEVYFSEIFAEQARSRSLLTTPADPSGYSVTFGQVIREYYLKNGIDLPSDDWHRHPDFGGRSRSEILSSAVFEAVTPLKRLDAACLLVRRAPKAR